MEGEKKKQTEGGRDDEAAPSMSSTTRQYHSTPPHPGVETCPQRGAAPHTSGVAARRQAHNHHLHAHAHARPPHPTSAPTLTQTLHQAANNHTQIVQKDAKPQPRAHPSQKKPRRTFRDTPPRQEDAPHARRLEHGRDERAVDDRVGAGADDVREEEDVELREDEEDEGDYVPACLGGTGGWRIGRAGEAGEGVGARRAREVSRRER